MPGLLGTILPADFVLLSSGLLVCFLSEAVLFSSPELSSLVGVGLDLSEAVLLAGFFLSPAEGEEDRDLEIEIFSEMFLNYVLG